MYTSRMLNVYIQHTNPCHSFILAIEPGLDEIYTQPSVGLSIFPVFTQNSFAEPSLLFYLKSQPGLQ